MTITQRVLDTRGERRVTVGAFGLWLDEYVREVGATPVRSPPPVPALSVLTVKDRTPALFHAASGIYGFVTLPVGGHDLLVTDPSGQHLPLLHRATVPDRAALVRDLEAGLRPPGGPAAIPIRHMRPAPGRAIPTGQTVLVGAVVDAAAAPVPWACVRLHIATARPDGAPPAAAGMDWVGLTDRMGGFLLWLRDLPYRPPPDHDGSPVMLSGTLTVRRRPASPHPADPTEALAASLSPDFDNIAATGTEDTFFSGTSVSQILPFQFGARTRVPAILLP